MARAIKIILIILLTFLMLGLVLTSLHFSREADFHKSEKAQLDNEILKLYTKIQELEESIILLQVELNKCTEDNKLWEESYNTAKNGADFLMNFGNEQSSERFNLAIENNNLKSELKDLKNEYEGCQRLLNYYKLKYD